jgi:hypothetical protein
LESTLDDFSTTVLDLKKKLKWFYKYYKSELALILFKLK